MGLGGVACGWIVSFQFQSLSIYWFLLCSKWTVRLSKCLTLHRRKVDSGELSGTPSNQSGGWELQYMEICGRLECDIMFGNNLLNWCEVSIGEILVGFIICKFGRNRILLFILDSLRYEETTQGKKSRKIRISYHPFLVDRCFFILRNWRWCSLLYELRFFHFGL